MMRALVGIQANKITTSRQMSPLLMGKVKVQWRKMWMLGHQTTPDIFFSWNKDKHLLCMTGKYTNTIMLGMISKSRWKFFNSFMKISKLGNAITIWKSSCYNLLFQYYIIAKCNCCHFIYKQKKLYPCGNKYLSRDLMFYKIFLGIKHFFFTSAGDSHWHVWANHSIIYG